MVVTDSSFSGIFPGSADQCSLGNTYLRCRSQQDMQCRRDRSVTQALALSVACHALMAGLRTTNSTNLRWLTAKDAKHATYKMPAHVSIVSTHFAAS